MDVVWICTNIGGMKREGYGKLSLMAWRLHKWSGMEGFKNNMDGKKCMDNSRGQNLCTPGCPR